ncbi:hypothetical protein ACFPOI_02005 [Nonomuraea angiospora]|uniref:Transposase n=1 Tax=Nonomuraea angiospora TaxID=46172 RepID=A0ABR9M2P4_9ACTN|nr:hypothetical protein [Nonomuraea angiospora]
MATVRTSGVWWKVCASSAAGWAVPANKRERIYQGTVDVASIRIWLRDPVQ